MVLEQMKKNLKYSAPDIRGDKTYDFYGGEMIKSRTYYFPIYLEGENVAECRVSIYSKKVDGKIFRFYTVDRVDVFRKRNKIGTAIMHKITDFFDKRKMTGILTSIAPEGFYESCGFEYLIPGDKRYFYHHSKNLPPLTPNQKKLLISILR